MNKLPALWLGVLLALSHQVLADARGPRVQLRAAPELCAEAVVNQQHLRRDANQAFPAVQVSVGAAHVICKQSLTVALPQEDSELTISLHTQQPPEFSGNAAPLNALLHTPPALGVRRLYSDLKRPDSEFNARRDQLQEQDRQRLQALEAMHLPHALLETERARAAFNLAAVRIVLPYFRWRETDASAIRPDPAVADLVKALPVEDPRWWSLDTFTTFTDAWLHETARERLNTDKALAEGDHRWLRASLASVDRLTTTPALRQILRDALVLKHVDADSSIGMHALLQDWQPTASAAAREKVQALLNDEPSQTGHASFVYQTVAQVPLRVHVLSPVNATAEPTPAVLWFHGGSSTEGAWWHMPVIATALRDQGVTVIGVELSTQNRLDRDADQLRDADAAWLWLKQHADELKLDTKRLGVAGFSSGATLALTTATRGFALSGTTREWPHAAIVMGACADPLAKEEDGWFRKSMQGKGDPAGFTPMGNVRQHLPPVLAIHGTDDEYCGWSTMQDFAQRSRALGNNVELVPIEGAAHFFGFYYRPGIVAARSAIQAWLTRQGWTEAGEKKTSR